MRDRQRIADPIADRIALYEQLNRYRALLRTQTDEKVCNTLREMIRELEERIAGVRPRPPAYRPIQSRDRDREEPRRRA